jgi:hypothetical protein
MADRMLNVVEFAELKRTTGRPLRMYVLRIGLAVPDCVAS